MGKLKVAKATVRRTTRKDHILHLRQRYEGNLHATPRTYNKAFASVFRTMADALEQIDDAWADPELVIWAFKPGLITAELPLSQPIKSNRKRRAQRLKNNVD